MMLIMLSSNMDTSIDCRQQLETIKNKTETTENTSDRESSIESFYTNKSELSIATETELIDVDDIELSDEESWLYKSPKKLTSEEKSESTQKWLEKSLDDMDDVELKATKTALLSKLNQLKLLNSSIMEREIKEVRQTDKSTSDSSIMERKMEEVRPTDGSTSVTSKLENQRKLTNDDLRLSKSQIFYTRMDSSAHSFSNNESASDYQEARKNSEVFDVTDVQKIARLQEESLKQSTYKFLSQAGKKTMSIKDLSHASPSSIVNLNKPASIEAINTCAEKMNSSNMFCLVPLHNMKKQNMFSSSTVLNNSHELHRGSLPNINKGYYSLKSKKSKRPSEPKISCPLPINPCHSKVSVNGTLAQGSSDLQKKTYFCDQRETRTLPSSYRVHSRSNSSSRKDISTLPISPRRESMPFLGHNSQELNQKDSHRKFSSPSIHPRYNISATTNQAKVFTSHTQNLRSPPSIESHRTASHSPSKRLPLSTVQHQSPKKGNNFPLSRNGEIKTLKMPSKIPSPALRSGIPVPSTAYSSKANEDDTWSQDCF